MTRGLSGRSEPSSWRVAPFCTDPFAAPFVIWTSADVRERLRIMMIGLMSAGKGGQEGREKKTQVFLLGR